MKRGEIFGKEIRKIKIIKWLDKGPVFMITIHPVHNANLVPTGKNNTVMFKIYFQRRLLLGKKPQR